MHRYTNFSEYPLGDHLDGLRDWTQPWDSGTTDVIVATGVPGGGGHGRTLQNFRSVEGRYANAWTGAGQPSGDVEVLAKLMTSDVGVTEALRLYLHVSDSPQNAYFVGDSGSDLLLRKYVSGALTTLDTAAMSLSADTWYWLRLQRTGTTIRARVWADGDPEPGSWLLSATDSDLSSGMAAFGGFSNGHTIYCDRFGVGTAGDPALMIDLLESTTGSGGLRLGGQAPARLRPGPGGLQLGGAATIGVRHGGQVPSEVEVLWDSDGDGDFDQPVEDITEHVLDIQTQAGRDWPSLLTGKSRPGELRATLDNSDDRFSYFNVDSPLNSDGHSLRTGRRIRVQVDGAGDPDPDELLVDEFDRFWSSNLGTAASGQTWQDPLTDGFGVAGRRAVATSEGDDHAAVVDLGQADYYLQVTIAEPGAATTGVDGNEVGIVYRWDSATDYSLAVLDVDAGQLQLRDIVGGTPSAVATSDVEVYGGLTLGVRTAADEVTLYHEGVEVLTAAAPQTAATSAGLWATWGAGNSRPEIDSCHAWTGLPTTETGVLFTGDVSDLRPSVVAGPRKIARLVARGWLSRTSGTSIRPPRSLGRSTGRLVGQSLAMARLAHPPGSIDAGDVTTGVVALTDQPVLESARAFEETEIGFLRESNEGYIDFDSRSARESTTPVVTFSDAPGAQFRYVDLELLDWRREIFNRVAAGATAATPEATLTVRTQDDLAASAALELQMPTTVQRGQLLIVLLAVGGTLDEWIVPPGWHDLTPSKPDVPETEGGTERNQSRTFVKACDGTESEQVLTFGTAGSSGSDRAVAAHIYRVDGWYGARSGGLTSSDYAGPFLIGGSDPPPLDPGWTREPVLYLVARAGWRGATSGVAVSGTTYPIGYTGGTSTLVEGDAAACVQTATRQAIVDGTETPDRIGGEFSFEGGRNSDAITIAVRGAPASTVQVEDTASQRRHNLIRTHRDTANLFADEGDAQQYANRIVDTFADDRPILRISFWATKSAAYRAQAIRRRIGHRIRLVATSRSGMGIDRDMFIESITHRWSQGVTLWRTTWELSPAPEE